MKWLNYLLPGIFLAVLASIGMTRIVARAHAASSEKSCPFTYTERLVHEVVLPALRRVGGDSYRHVEKADHILVYKGKSLVSFMFTPDPTVQGRAWDYTVEYNPCTHRILSIHITSPVIE